MSTLKTENIQHPNALTANMILTASATSIPTLNVTTKLIAEQSMTVALSDETTSITTGTSKITMRAPFAMTLTKIPRASVNTVSTSGLPTVDINKNGVSIFSTTLSIDVNEKTSVTAATTAVFAGGSASFADDDEITFDIDVAGTGTKGLKVTLYYRLV